MTSRYTNEAIYVALMNDEDFLEELDDEVQSIYEVSDDPDYMVQRIADFVSGSLNDAAWLFSERYVEDSGYAGSESIRSAMESVYNRGRAAVSKASAKAKPKAPAKKSSTKKAASKSCKSKTASKSSKSKGARR